MQSTQFNLTEVISALQKRWKTITFFVFVVMVITATTLFFVPRYYGSKTIVVPANPELADKSRLFNGNIQHLYSFYGNGDDLEILYGITQLDTVYRALVDEFKLVDYFEIKSGMPARQRENAIKKLMSDVSISKTELNQLKVIVYSRDNNLAADIANRLVSLAGQIEQEAWKQSNKNSAEKLESSASAMEKQAIAINDSLTVAGPSIQLLINRKQSLMEQVQQNQKKANEFRLALADTPQAFFVVEKAVPSASPDKPNVALVLISAFLLSLVFAGITVLVYDRKATV